MYRLTGVGFILYCIQITNAISVQVDGLVDLGPNWSYEYKIVTPKLPNNKYQSFTNNLPFTIEIPSIVTHTQYRFKKIEALHEKYSTPPTKPVTEITNTKNDIDLEAFMGNDNLQVIYSHSGSSNNVTNTYKENKINELTEDFISRDDIYIKTRAIKNDKQINSFIKHVFKQALEVLSTLRHKTDDYKIKKKIDLLTKTYNRKFKEFIADTKKQSIKSRLGVQKVILNTIDVSDRILTRLVNLLISDMDKKGLLRNSLTTANIFQNVVEKETELEYKHACTQFGICRTSSGFSDFISIVLVLDDKKLKLCIVSFTEVFNDADFSKTLDKSTEGKFKKSVNNLEDLDPFIMKAILMIAKNIINNKNRPLIVHNRVGGRINQTLAALELIDIVDKNIPSNEENKLEWNDLKGSLQQWIDGKRTDTMEIMESFVNMLKIVMESLGPKILEKIKNIVKFVFK